MKTLIKTLMLGMLVTGCSPNADLTETKNKLKEANEKITALEGQLASARAGTLAATESKPMPTVAVAEAAQPSVETKPGQQWDYEITEDPMSGKKRYTASVKSTNTVSLGFPYGGAQHGTLTLRIHEGKGKDVLFFIEQGQILCPSYNGCSAQVRFDDEKPIRFGANGPADHSSDIIFLENYGNFVSKLKKSKRVRLSVNIYQNGAPAFEFDISGFDPDRYQPKS